MQNRELQLNLSSLKNEQSFFIKLKMFELQIKF